MPKFDIIADRISQGICPICTKAIELEYQIIEDQKYGKVKVCRNHDFKLIRDIDENY